MILPTAADVTVAWSFHQSVCLSVTLVHPAKAVGRNEMPFGRDTCVVPSNIILDGFQSPKGRKDFRVGTPVYSDAAYCQITLGPDILAELSIKLL